MANIYNALISRSFSNEAGTEPVSLEDAKDYIKLSTGATADDGLIETLITTSRRLIENQYRVALIQKDVEVVFLHNIDFPYTLPTVPQTVTSAFFRPCRLHDWAPLGAGEYELIGNQFSGALNGQYKLVYQVQPLTGSDMDTAIRAILENVAELYFNRGDGAKITEKAAMICRTIGTYAI